MKFYRATAATMADANIVITGVPDESRSHALRKGTETAPDTLRAASNESEFFVRDGKVIPTVPMRGTLEGKRVFDAGELSDGTLRYLALAGALLGYRLPAFIALNEPETSLHPELLEPLARLIMRAAERTQVWVVTHSERLAQAFADAGAVSPRMVIKRDGETWIEGLSRGGGFAEDKEEDD